MARALDIGSQYPSDAADSSQPSQVANRSQFDFFTGPEAREAEDYVLEEEEEEVDLSDAQPLLYQIQSETNDTLVCRAWISGAVSGDPIFVAKPIDLQRSRFDGETVNGKTYDYYSQIERLVEEGNDVYIETLNQAYNSGDLILAARPVDGDTNVTDADWIDLNISARRFDRKPITKWQMRVKSQGNDYLICRTWDGTTEGDDDIYVMKPWILRYTPFHGKTVNGVSYSYSNFYTRVADSEETQIITQDYYTNAVILIEEQDVLENPTTGVYTRYVDSNDSGRAWAEPEA